MTPKNVVPIDPMEQIEKEAERLYKPYADFEYLDSNAMKHLCKEIAYCKVAIRLLTEKLSCPNQ
jgi:hypothetical protein